MHDKDGTGLERSAEMGRPYTFIGRNEFTVVEMGILGCGRGTIEMSLNYRIG